MVGRYAIVLFLGTLFGLILTKAQVISWFRIQEMFRFQSFHMYGVLMSAIATAAISVQIIQRFKLKSIFGERIELKPKRFHPGVVIGGFMFGLGWALTGACPGPMFALLGGGFGVFSVVIVSAVLGTYVYGWLRPYLPH
jgi:Predicted transporter component